MRESAHVVMIPLLLPLPGALPCSCFAEQGCMDMGGLPGAKPVLKPAGLGAAGAGGGE